MLDEQLSVCGAIDAALGQRRIEAALATAMHGFQAQVGGREHRSRRQQGVGELHQGIGTALKAVVERLAIGLQGGEPVKAVDSFLASHSATCTRSWLLAHLCC